MSASFTIVSAGSCFSLMETLEDRQLLSALLWTDKLDYAPGSTAIIYGSGFAPGETVQLTLDHLAGTTVGASHVATAPWTVQADGQGLFSSSWPVTDPDAVNATYILSALGETDGLSAQTIFTDKTNTASGEGHLVLTTSPASLLPGTSGNTLTFTFMFNPGDSGHAYKNGSTATILVPAGWTAPQTTDPAGAGYVSIVPVGGSASISGITGSAADGWTVGIDFTAINIEGFVLTYSGVTTPIIGTYTFTTSTAIPGETRVPLYDNSSPTVAFLLETTLSTVSATGTYGGNVDLSATLTSEGAPLAGRTVNFTLDGISVGSAVTNASGVAALSSASLLGINAGSYVGGVVATFAGDSEHHTSSASADLTVNQATLTVSASATASSKVYDGTNAASVTLSDDRVTGDDLAIGFTSATFSDKNVGAGKTVTISGLTLSGSAAANYVLASSQITTTADITAATLTVSATAGSKTYDGTDDAVVTLSDDRIAGDTLSIAYSSASFADKNVGLGKLVTVSDLVLGGADAGNYVLASTSATATADISAATLNVSATGSNKVYDGTTGATVTLSDDRVSGDDLTFTYAASFADKNVGAGKAISVSGIALGGADAGNYILASTSATTSGDITAASLTATVTVASKVYDGTASASITDRSLSGAIAGDLVSLTGGAATFSDKNAGAGKVVTVTGLTLTGADAGNYVLVSSSVTTTADIAAASLSPSITAASKVYNGTTAATITGRTLTGVIGADAVSLTGGTATFADKNVGVAKLVTATGLTLTGADAGNYVLIPASATTTANITAASLVPGITAASKVYDGTTAATITGRTLTGVVGTDAVSLTGGSATFASKNVGAAKVVTAIGLSLSGADAGNYILSATTATTTASITAASLAPSITAASRVYNGTTAASLTGRSLAGIIGADVVSLTGGTATFANKNVGTGKVVTATGLTLTGADAGNYVLSSTTATTTANITAASLTVWATGVNKIYDGTTAATVILSHNGLAGDAVTASYTSAVFADKNVGDDKPVSVSGISLSGADAGNYQLTSTTAATTADIRAAEVSLVVTATGINKVYDGTTAASVTLSDNRIAGDSLTASYASAVFADKNVGSGKTITVTGITLSGADAGNYSLASATVTTTASITPATLTVSASGDDKVYDGTTAATVSLSDDRIAGDLVSLSYGSANFADKNAGDDKQITISGITISGDDAGNYTLAADSVVTTASITRATLTVSATAMNKVYDATTAATATLADDRVAGDVLSATYTSATFGSKNVGLRTVTISGIALSGANAGNYVLASDTLTAAASITPATLTATIKIDVTVTNGVSTGVISARSLTGIRSGDTVALTGGSPVFGQQVSVKGLRLIGRDAANYVLGSVTIKTTARVVTMTGRGPRILRIFVRPLTYAGARLAQMLVFRA